MNFDSHLSESKFVNVAILAKKVAPWLECAEHSKMAYISSSIIGAIYILAHAAFVRVLKELKSPKNEFVKLST